MGFVESRLPSEVIRFIGGGVIFRKFSRKVRTPKLVMALPKKIGVSSPANTSSILNSSPAMSNNSISSCSWSYKWSPRRERKRGSSGLPKSPSIFLRPWSLPLKTSTNLLVRLYTPLKLPSIPIGQFIGKDRIPSTFSISSISSKGSLDCLSILLIKVKMGIPRILQTWKSLMVCASTPLPPSINITALSAAIRVRYVSSLKSWWPGVSNMLIRQPS